MLPFREGLLKGSDGKYFGSSFSLKRTRNNKDGIKFVCGLQLQSLNIYEAWFSIFSLLFFSDRAQPETLQWRRGYLSVPVRHSIRTDGSSVIKMALCYNSEDEDARERVLASVFAVGERRFRRVMNALFTGWSSFVRQKRFANYDRVNIVHRQITTQRMKWSFGIKRILIYCEIINLVWLTLYNCSFLESQSSSELGCNCNLQLLWLYHSCALHLSPSAPASLFLPCSFSGVSGCLLNFIFRAERFQRSTPSSEHTSLNGLLTW